MDGWATPPQTKMRDWVRCRTAVWPNRAKGARPCPSSQRGSVASSGVEALGVRELLLPHVSQLQRNARNDGSQLLLTLRAKLGPCFQPDSLPHRSGTNESKPATETPTWRPQKQVGEDNNNGRKLPPAESPRSGTALKELKRCEAAAAMVEERSSEMLSSQPANSRSVTARQLPAFLTLADKRSTKGIALSRTALDWQSSTKNRKPFRFEIGPHIEVIPWFSGLTSPTPTRRSGVRTLWCPSTVRFPARPNEGW